MSSSPDLSGPTINWKRQRIATTVLSRAHGFLRASGLNTIVRSLHHAWQAPLLRRLLPPNAVLKDAFLGQRCFFLGSAPSINEVDFGALADEYTFGCNFLCHHQELRRLRRLYYAEIEPLWTFPFIGLDPIGYYRYIDDAVPPDAVLFLRAGNARFFQRHDIFTGRRVHWVESGRNMNESSELSIDLTQRMNMLDGVVYFAIAAALYMGFREIYLCGAGFTYSPRQQGHFYSRESIAPLPQPGEPRHVRAYALARSLGAEIWNITPDGFESPFYPRTTWAAVRQRLAADDLADRA